jgi:HK97 gp10 family phage protein
MPDNSVRVDTARLDRMIAGLTENERRPLRQFAFRIEALAKTKAPYLTGALSNSGYTKTDKEDNYEKAKAEAESAAAKEGKTIITEPLPSVFGDIVAVTGFCISYAGYQEFGTSRMSAQPFLIPAAEQLRDSLFDPNTWLGLVPA